MKKILTIFLMVILVILNCTLSIIFIISEYNYSFLIIDENNVWRYSDSGIKKINKSQIKRLSYENVKIYSDIVVDGYYDYSNAKLYNLNLEKIDFSSNVVVNKGNNTIKNYSNKITNNIDINDEFYINNLLQSLNKTEKIKDLIIFKLQISDENILYSISPSSSNIDDDSYSIIFLNSNGINNIIYNKTKNNNKDYRLSSLNKVIDLYNNGNIDIILLSDISGSAGNECYSLYEYNLKNNKYEKIIDCEE